MMSQMCEKKQGRGAAPTEHSRYVWPWHRFSFSFATLEWVETQQRQKDISGERVCGPFRVNRLDEGCMGTFAESVCSWQTHVVKKRKKNTHTWRCRKGERERQSYIFIKSGCHGKVFRCERTDVEPSPKRSPHEKDRTYSSREMPLSMFWLHPLESY